MTLVNKHSKSFKSKWHFSHTGFDMSFNECLK